ncbi:putative DNA-binding domain-containing protein [Silvanigrella aquatica]|uniref:Putative DNA-binding domain-containing protein n=1 Tax=Silvanigrella aquatica TaxID=1915309 RepID=A0A1L4CXQ0_9BACT|nr:putative DNA-binding domain-containing protein [Silvanigrella aquatica]APJ02732.1 hypothetical protein AXG55_01840 [Silvanigrella aquatica]
MNKFSILTLQKRFADFLKRGSLNSNHEIENSIVNQSSISVEERLLIYKNAYKIRMHETLKQDYPKVYQVLNQEMFYELVEEYLMRSPSQNWNLNDFSSNLPNFIAQSKWSIEYKFLSDLAEFEWLKVLSFYSDEITPFNFSEISKIPVENHNKIVLYLAPSVVLYRARWAVHCVGNKKFIPKRSHFYIIYKNKGEVHSENIPQVMWRILMKISEGLCIEKIIDSDNTLDEQKISKNFHKWVSKGIISHYSYTEE